MPRLLVCRECQTIETFPLWDGPPELESRDPMLNDLVSRHVQKHGDAKVDSAALLVASEEPCNCGEKTTFDVTGRRLPSLRVREAHTFWEGHRDDVLKGLRERWTGFHPEYYATVDTFKEDSIRCWNLHRRPKGTDCIDWRSDRKRLTSEDRPKDKHIYLCLSGDTRILHPFGRSTLRAAAALSPTTLLTTDKYDGHSAAWVEVSVSEYGEARLWAITLRRNQQVKVLRATADHRWCVRRKATWSKELILETRQLSPGDRLAHARPPLLLPEPDEEGIRRGIHFGDGSTQHREHATYGTVTLWGQKRELHRFFGGAIYEVVNENELQGWRITHGMKDYRKDLPSLDEEPGYLYGWLQGYFATDGSVGRSGQLTISSAVYEHLDYVRDLCTVLGIGTYAPTGHLRTNPGVVKGASVDKPLFKMGIARNDVTEEFFLRSDHRSRWSPGHYERFGWTVESVEETGEVEPVYCATVPGTHTFVLEDNILTMNCDFCPVATSVTTAMRSAAGMYNREPGEID